MFLKIVTLAEGVSAGLFLAVYSIIAIGAVGDSCGPTVTLAQLRKGGTYPIPFAALSFPDSKNAPIYFWVDRVLRRRMARPEREFDLPATSAA